MPEGSALGDDAWGLLGKFLMCCVITNNIPTALFSSLISVFVCIHHVLLMYCSDPFLSTVLELSKEEIRRSKDVKKILASINV